MPQVVIIGNGPAGISTSLYTSRAGIDTIIIGKDSGSLKSSDKIENYYGFAKPITGEFLINEGINQAKNLGANYYNDEVLGIGFTDKLIVKTNNNEFFADYLVIATGVVRNKINIEGSGEYEGKGISYCAVCDGFFYKGRDVCVVGNGDYAISECEELLKIANTVTLLTDNNILTNSIELPPHLLINDKKIKKFIGDGTLKSVEFDDGTTLEVVGAFIALGTASSDDLAKKLGVTSEDKKIIVNEFMQTNIPNIYAVGDCVGGIYQIAKAVNDGMVCGIHISKSSKKGV